MSEKQPNNILTFLKKNAYYFVVGISLIALAVIMVMVAVNNSKVIDVDKQGKDSQSAIVDSTDDNSQTSSKSDEQAGKTQSESADSSKQDEPTDSRIIFETPVLNASVSKEFTSDTVVFNQTLGVYTGHMGVDFLAEEGTEVCACYAGTVESITASYLKGTTVTINHGNGLKSIYNSIDAIENLTQGQKVEGGQPIGYVSDNNRQEYKDGPHLHLEVSLNDEKVDPMTYLDTDEK